MTEDDGPTKKPPWTFHVPTITCHARIVVRQIDVNYEVTIKFLSGMELFQLLGWDRLLWDNPSPMTESNAIHMVGNAFSMYGIGPIFILAVLVTYGSEGTPTKTNAAETDKEADEEMDSEGDRTSEDMSDSD